MNRSRMDEDILLTPFRVHGFLPVLTRSATIVKATGFTSGRGVRTGRRVYASLSAAGTAITGYPVNGWLFWQPIDNTSRASERDATA